MTTKEITAQQIAFMGHVEEICERHDLVPPVEVNVSNADGNQYDFGYSPEYDLIDLPPAPIMLPVTLSFTDANGIRVERRLSDFAQSPEWKKLFLQ